MSRAAPLMRFVVCLCSGLGGPLDASASTRLLVGPYVPDLDGQSATVAFELSQPSPARVVLRDGDGQVAVESPSAKSFHVVSVAGLSPGTSYQYSISAGGSDLGPRGRGLLRTASLPAESFSFAVIGDTRPGENQTSLHHRALAEQMSLDDPAFYLHLGDMVDAGDVAAHWHGFFEVQGELLRRTAVFPTLGDNDHAEGKGLASKYFPRLGRGFYAFEWGGVHFFGLRAWDTRGRQPKAEYDQQSEQMRWLEQELAKPQVQQAPFRVVFLHDPVMISRGRSSSFLRGIYAPLFEAHRVDLVLASWHLYERSRINGVTYVISGGGGAGLLWSPKDPEIASLAEAERYHYCRVDVSASGLSLRAIAEDGTVLDRVMLSTSTGGDTRDRERSRLAARMADRFVVGKGQGASVPVYLFEVGRTSRERIDEHGKLREDAVRRGLVYEIYAYDVRKRGVYDLLLQAAVESDSTVTGLPAVFVGNQRVASVLEIPAAHEEKGGSESPAMFQKRVDVTPMRNETAQALGSGTVVGAGARRSLNAWMVVLLGVLGERLLRRARRRRSVLGIGGGLVGGLLLLRLVLDLSYYDIVRSLPWLEAALQAAAAFPTSLAYFTIQDMMAHSASRSLGLQWMVLYGLAWCAPAVLVVLGVETFSRIRR